MKIDELLKKVTTRDEVDEIIISNVGKEIEKKIDFLSNYMKVKKISSSHKKNSAEIIKELYESLIECFLEGDWKYLNGVLYGQR